MPLTIAAALLGLIAICGLYFVSQPNATSLNIVLVGLTLPQIVFIGVIVICAAIIIWQLVKPYFTGE